jgi:hypothetical protein
MAAFFGRNTASRPLPALSAAGQEDEHRSNEEEDHRGETGPHADAIEGVVSGIISVDVMLDYLG